MSTLRNIAMGALAAAALAALGAGCNLGAQNHATRVSLAFTQLECTALQNPANGGSPMVGTFVAVAGAEFPPITELRRGVHPCTSETPPDVVELAVVDVRVPDGDKRAIAIAIVGPTLDLPALQVAEIAVEGIRLGTFEPRTLFFGGGDILRRDELLPDPAGVPATVVLNLEPFVNLLGRVRENGEDVAARITFFLPDESGGCLQVNDTEDSPALTKIFAIDSKEAGGFFANVPYRATDADCISDAHGAEVFALVESKRSNAVALYVPGRALGSSAGLQPGMLVKHTTVYLHERSDASNLILSSVTQIPRAGALELFVSGWAQVESLPDTFTVSAKPLPDGAPFDITLAASHKLPLGDGVPEFGVPALSSYDRVRIFGDRKPFGMKLTAEGIAAGDYRMQLPNGTQFTFGITAAQE